MIVIFELLNVMSLIFVGYGG